MPSTSVQISLSGAVPPASKRPTTVQRYAPNLIVWPVAQSLNRLETLRETATSDLPGVNQRPSTSVRPGRSFIPFSPIPRIVTFEEPPSRFSRFRTTTSSAEASGLPSPSGATPGGGRVSGTRSRGMPDCSSDCEFCLSTSTLFSEPEAVKTRVRPSPRDMTQRKTATTRPIPSTVRPVVTFLTNRFRMLYLSGIPSIGASLGELSQALHDRPPGRADRRHESGEQPDGERRGEGGGKDVGVDAEAGGKAGER